MSESARTGRANADKIAEAVSVVNHNARAHTETRQCLEETRTRLEEFVLETRATLTAHEDAIAALEKRFKTLYQRDLHRIENRTFALQHFDRILDKLQSDFAGRSFWQRLRWLVVGR